MSNKDKFRHRISEIVIQGIYLCIGLLIAFPIIYAFFISFMDPAQVLTGGVNIIPKKWTLENYYTCLLYTSFRVCR